MAALQCATPARNASVIGAAYGASVESIFLLMHTFHDAGLDATVEGIFITSHRWKLPAAKTAPFGWRSLVPGLDFPINEETAAAAGRHAPHSLRFLHAKALLQAWGHCWEKVMLIDTRDTYFQADPFKWVHDGLYVTQERAPAYNNSQDTLQGNPCAPLTPLPLYCFVAAEACADSRTDASAQTTARGSSAYRPVSQNGSGGRQARAHRSSARESCWERPRQCSPTSVRTLRHCSRLLTGPLVRTRGCTTNSSIRARWL